MDSILCAVCGANPCHQYSSQFASDNCQSCIMDRMSANIAEKYYAAYLAVERNRVEE